MLLLQVGSSPPRNLDASTTQGGKALSLTSDFQQCRQRRVKCDETRPSCLRCIRFKIDCDGYPAPKNPRYNTVHTERKLHPNPLKAGSYLVAMPSSELRFADDLEERHFRNFQMETAAELSGIFDTTFWNRLLLQACHEEPFVKKIVMALSAVSTSKKLSLRTNSSAVERAINAQQTGFALMQYQKALKEIRTSLASRADSRKAVIACLLVCCFESLLGNLASAHAHALSGQKLLEQWLVQHPYTRSCDVGIASPAQHLIEDDILKAGVFFDAQLLSFQDPRPAYIHAKLRLEGEEAIAQMPKRLKNIGEAHRYLFLSYKRVLHSCREIGELCQDGRLSTTADYKIVENGIEDLCLNPQLSTIGPTKQEVPVEASLIFTVQQKGYLSELQRWRSAFSNLYESIKLSSNKRLISAADSLMALSKTLDVCLYVSLDTDNCSCDHLSAEFHEIYALSSEIASFIKSDHNHLNYSFELAVIPAIFVVSRFCRERELRRKAITLLEKFEMSEGTWDSNFSAAFVRKLMELEEEGVETEFVPEGARVRVINEIFHMERRICVMKYIRGTKRTGETTGEAVYYW